MSDPWTCPNCGYLNAAILTVCTHCGAVIDHNRGFREFLRKRFPDGESWVKFQDLIDEVKRASDAGEEVIILKRDHLNAIFDLAINSMDFGSGFWDNEDVEAVRGIAMVLGLNPMLATPHNFKRSYRHAWKGRNTSNYGSHHLARNPNLVTDCIVCGEDRDHPVHNQERTE